MSPASPGPRAESKGRALLALPLWAAGAIGFVGVAFFARPSAPEPVQRGLTRRCNECFILKH
jgi:hypothetical protein